MMVVEVVDGAFGGGGVKAKPPFSCRYNIDTTINRGRWGDIGPMAEIYDSMICIRLL